MRNDTLDIDVAAVMRAPEFDEDEATRSVYVSTYKKDGNSWKDHERTVEDQIWC